MNKLKIGIICPSEIANRRFLPALKTIENVEFIGVAVNSAKERYGENIPSAETVEEMLKTETQRAREMVNAFGGKLYDSYSDIVFSSDIDAIYIPLPPALHYKWAKKALAVGKHVLVEKPSTISQRDTADLIGIAKQNKLALHENYMFVFHDQLKAVNRIIEARELGDVRLYRISFGFPMRAVNDFRYMKQLGGGALLDAGGYTIKYASYLLGESAQIVYAHMNHASQFEVDLYGSGALINDEGVTAQIAFGMDNEYKCELEIWGSKGTLTTGRILTAPAGFVPTARIVRNGKEETFELPTDDAFRKSILCFMRCIEDDQTRENNYALIQRQAKLVQQFMDMAEN